MRAHAHCANSEPDGVSACVRRQKRRAVAPACSVCVCVWVFRSRFGASFGVFRKPPGYAFASKLPPETKTEADRQASESVIIGGARGCSDASFNPLLGDMWQQLEGFGGLQRVASKHRTSECRSISLGSIRAANLTDPSQHPGQHHSDRVVVVCRRHCLACPGAWACADDMSRADHTVSCAEAMVCDDPAAFPDAMSPTDPIACVRSPHGLR